MNDTEVNEMGTIEKTIKHNVYNEDFYPFSFEFGKAGERHKIKYRDEEDGQKKVKIAMSVEKLFKSLKEDENDTQ